MRILLVNDDGIFSPGLYALEKALENSHEVWVMAPDRERSGVSQSITFADAIRVLQVADQRFAVGGTPADCTILALKGDWIPRPDVIVSGINAGPNLGTDVVYSGTCAAARQGAFMGVPGIAVSLNRYGFDSDFDPAARILSLNLETLVHGWKPGFFWNINVPVELSDDRLYKATLCRRVYHDRVESFFSPSKERFCFTVGNIATESAQEPESDGALMFLGRTSLSRVKAQPSVWNDD